MSTRVQEQALKMHVVYLHGFASSPQSSKALFLGERLATCGITLHCPDLNEPDFSTLTVSRMVGQVERLIDGLAPESVALIGSSLGAFVAVHIAERARRSPAGTRSLRSIEKLVLLAPALDFGTNRMPHLGPDGLERWRVTNRLDVEHYAEGRVRHVHHALYEDARTFDSFAATAALPTLILHGRRDDMVDPAMVERYACGRDHVTLVWLDDDHQLKASLEQVWQETARFLGVASSAG